MHAATWILSAIMLAGNDQDSQRGTHVWIQLYAQVQVECYFDSTVGVTGVSAAQSAAAFAAAETHPSDPDNLNCNPLSGVDASADIAIGFGQLAFASTRVEVPNPRDSDCAQDPSSPECHKITLCNGCSTAEAVARSAPTSGSPNRIKISTIYQTAAAYYECGFDLRTPPALIEPMTNGGATAESEARYSLTQPRVMTIKITTEAVLLLFPCGEVIGCTPRSEPSRGLLASPRIDTAIVCGAGGPAMYWFEHSTESFRHSGQFSVNDKMDSEGGSRSAVATLSHMLDADETHDVSIQRESLETIELGDSDRNGDIDRCDLVHLRCLLLGGDVEVCDSEYLVRADLDLDGRLDGNDELELIGLLPPVPGDATGDWKVSFADITHVLTNWGQMGVGQFGGDVNLDGVVNFGDVNYVNANYNKGVPNADPECSSCP